MEWPHYQYIWIFMAEFAELQHYNSFLRQCSHFLCTYLSLWGGPSKILAWWFFHTSQGLIGRTSLVLVEVVPKMEPLTLTLGLREIASLMITRVVLPLAIWIGHAVDLFRCIFLSHAHTWLMSSTTQGTSRNLHHRGWSRLHIMQLLRKFFQCLNEGLDFLG